MIQSEAITRGMWKKKRRILVFSLLGACVVFLVVLKTLLPGYPQKKSEDQSLLLLRVVADLIRDNYVEEPNPVRTMKGAFRGLIAPLDPLSSYLDPASVLKVKQLGLEAFQETGLILYKTFGNYPMVVGIVEDSPAAEAGIKIGDAISEMDGQPLLMLSMLEANLYLKDKEGRPARIRLLRSDSPQEIEVPRKRLYETPFSFSSAPGTAGILTLRDFYPSLTQRLRETWLPSFRESKKPLILDFRNCHEGRVEEALRFANLFFQAERVGHFQGQSGEKTFVSCPEKPVLNRNPLIVWTNQATIGPAEAAAGALRAFRGARIVGLRTPGLVAKQRFFPLPDGSGLLLTSEIFHLSRKEPLWLKGLTPDKKLAPSDQSQARYLEESRELFPKQRP